MPKKAQAKTNSYACYVNEYRDKHKFMTFQEAAARVTSQWKNLSKKEKDRYEEMAIRANGTRQKFTTTGETVEEIESQVRNEKLKQDKKKRDVEQMIEDAINKKTIKTKTFNIMHMHFYCHRNGMYYPAEVSICKFSLLKGIEAIYHKIIYPGKLPLGSSHDAKLHANETHQLPIPTDENNLDQVVEEIIQFLTHGNNVISPVFAREEGSKDPTIDVIENIMQYAFEGVKLRVLSAEYFFFQLKKQLEGPAAMPAFSLAAAEFNKDLFEFTSELYCDYHESSDVPYKCSKSMVGRLVFIICDNVCSGLNITLIPGSHLPKSSEVDGQLMSANASVSSSRMCLSKGEYDSETDQINFICESDTETVIENEGEWHEASRKRNKYSASQISNYSHDSKMSQNSHSYGLGPLSQGTQHSQVSSASSLNPCRRPNQKILSNFDVSESIPMSGLNLSQFSDTSNSGPAGSIHEDFPQLPPPTVGGAAPRMGKGRGRGLWQKAQQ